MYTELSHMTMQIFNCTTPEGTIHKNYKYEWLVKSYSTSPEQLTQLLIIDNKIFINMNAYGTNALKAVAYGYI